MLATRFSSPTIPAVVIGACLVAAYCAVAPAAVLPEAPGGPPSRPRLTTDPAPTVNPGRIVVRYRPGIGVGPFAPLEMPAAVEELLLRLAPGAPIVHRPLLPQIAAPRAAGDSRALRRAAARQAHALDRVDVITVPLTADVRALCEALAALAEVEYAHPDYLLPFQFVPNDPFFSSADSWGQGYADLYGPHLMDCPPAWDVTQGQGVVVALVDSGLDHAHPDIAANLWINSLEDINGNGRYDNWPADEKREGAFGDLDEIDNDGNGYVDDVIGYDFSGDGQTPDGDPFDRFGHGTHVGGTIAAVGDNGLGIVGVAPQCRLMALKISADNSAGVSTIAAAEALVYLADNGARVSNSSWGGFGSEVVVPELKAAFDYAADLDVLNVIAAGNANSDVALVMPANFGRNLVVGAADHEDRRAFFSNFGLLIDVSAPGGGELEPAALPRPEFSILSLAAAGSTIERLENGAFVVSPGYVRLAGTSMAAPHAAGAAALLRAAYPGETWQDTRARLKIGAEPIDALNPDHAGLIGAGRVNVYDSLTAAPQPLLELAAISPQGLVAPDRVFSLRVTIHNDWRDATNVQLTLTSPAPLVFVEAGEAALGDLPSGQSATNTAEPFSVYVDPSLAYGELLPFELTAAHDDGTATFLFNIPTQLFQDVIAETRLPVTGPSSITLRMQELDADRYPEVMYTHAFGNLSLMRNRGDGTFASIPLPVGVHVTFGMNLVDFDDDGLRDLIAPGNAAGRSESKFIFRNNGNGTFSEAQQGADLQAAPANAVLALDYNGDRLVDLIMVGNHQMTVLRNDGGFSFTNVSDAVLPDKILGNAGLIDATLADVDNDGHADIIATGGGVLAGIQLYRNRGDGTFEDITPYAGIPFIETQDLVVGDFDNDGNVDIFTADYFGEGPANRLFRNNGDATFTDVTADSGALYEINPDNRPSAFRGSAALDYDNDGWLDIFVQCGDYVTTPYARLYRNNGNGTFADVTAASLTIPSGVRYTASYADYDDDGDLDIHLSDSIFGSAGFFKNFTTSLPEPNHWLKVYLVGTQSDRDAFGARVTVVAGGQSMLRDVTLGENATQPLHFGLGAADRADEIIIRWPSGLVQRHRNIAADESVTFTEGRFAPGDWNGDGALDLSDFNAFASCYGDSDEQCLTIFDFDENGAINLDDFSTFAVLFTSSTWMLVDAGPAQTIYINQSVALGPPVVSGGRAPYSYSWEPTKGLDDPADPAPVAAPLETTRYTLTVMDAQGQTAEDSVLVRVLPMTVLAGHDVALYSGESTTLGPAVVLGGIAPYTYEWAPTAGLADPDQPQTDAAPAQTTDYTLTVTDSADPPHVAVDTVRVYVDGIIELADMNSGVRGWTIYGAAAGDDFGASVALAGDVNDDGLEDIIVGAPSADPNGNRSGAAYVIFGGSIPAAGVLNVTALDGSNGFMMPGAAAGDQAGWDVAGLGDVNGDNIADFAVSAPTADPNSADSGTVYVVFGRAGIGAGGTLSLAALAAPNGFRIHGAAQNDNAGSSVAAGGDLNHDGRPDIVLSSPRARSGGFVTGAAHVIFGADDLTAVGTVQLGALAPPRGFSAWGVAEGDRAGNSLRAAGDVNGDTYDDLLIGAYAYDTVRDIPPDGPTNIVNVGALYLLYGGPGLGAGGDVMLGALDGSDGVVFVGREEGDFFGLSLGAPGDLNGDGLADFLVSAPYARPHGNFSGRAYLVYGAATHGVGGRFEMNDLDAATGVVFNGTAVQDFAGWSLAGGFDLNDDGERDFAVGAVLADRSVFSKNVGFTYVIYGGPGFGAPETIELADIVGPNGYQAHGVSSFDESATSLANIGDWNGDGRDDLLIGAGSAETDPNIRPGAVYVVFGQP